MLKSTVSLYDKVTHSQVPYFNLDEEVELHQIISKLISEKCVQSCHDLSEGGLFIALMESSMAINKGFNINSTGNIRPDAYLFGESQTGLW